MDPKSDSTSPAMQKSRAFFDAMIILGLGAILYISTAHLDLAEWFNAYSREHEDWELDELLLMSFYFTVALAIFALRRWKDIIKSERELARRNQELEEALAEVKQLQGIIPICASCKKIRDDQGFWHQVEAYVQAHSGAEFSHGLCPDCMKKLYPEIWAEEEAQNQVGA